jgi:hypothetical protein
MTSPTPRTAVVRQNPRRQSLRLPLVLLGALAPFAQAGRGIAPFGTGSVEHGGNLTFITPLVGRTIHEVTPLDEDPATPEVTTDPQTWIFGLNLSTYRMVNPLFIPGIGLGVHLDDGTLAVDLIPKVATLFGVIAVGSGITLSDGSEPGFVMEGWCAIFAGLRLRKTWIGETGRTSLSGFMSIPLSL